MTRGGGTGRAGRTYWITERSEVEALASAIRLDIIDWLEASGPLSVRELATALGRKPTAIYHHLKQMEDVGLIKTTQANGDRGRPAQLYQTVSPVMRLARAPLQPENRDAMARIVRTVAGQSAKEYAAAFKSHRSEIVGPGRNHWFFRVVAAPSPQRLAQINKLLDKLTDLIWAPEAQAGELMSFAWVLAPLLGAERAAPSGARPPPRPRARRPGRESPPPPKSANARRPRRSLNRAAESPRNNIGAFEPPGGFGQRRRRPVRAAARVVFRTVSLRSRR